MERTILSLLRLNSAPAIVYTEEKYYEKTYKRKLCNQYFKRHFKDMCREKHIPWLLLHWWSLINIINDFNPLMTSLPLQVHLLSYVHGQCNIWMLKWIRLSVLALVSFDSVFLILLSTAAAAVAEKYLSELGCIHPWLVHCFIVLEGLGLSLLPIWNVSCLSEWSEAACSMDAQCPEDGAPLHCSEHPPSSYFVCLLLCDIYRELQKNIPVFYIYVISGNQELP